NCANTSIGATPLIDLGDSGALYDDGNTMPAAHAAVAPPLTPVNGVIGVVSLGMSNAVGEWETFQAAADTMDDIAEVVEFGNGSVGGNPMETWADPDADAWTIAVNQIADDGLQANEVQVVWMKMGSQLGQLNGDLDERIEQERGWLTAVIANAADVFPNIKRIYMSSRTYGGYGVNENHMEPHTGYDNGFSVKTVVSDAVAGLTDVWAAWGPYIWADGTTPRSDGLTWECSDVGEDGIHPSKSGENKVAEMIFEFFSSDATTCSWFLADPAGCGAADPLDLGPFTDVPWDYLFVSEIQWLADNQITLGCNPPDNDLFCPDGFVTRAQMAAFLVRALHFPDGVETFTDDNDSIFEKDIEALAAAGVTLGCNPPDNDLFCPDAFVTRGQMAAFLVRALGLPPGVEKEFADDDNSIFEEDIEALAAAEITLGCNPPLNSNFCPDDYVTRGQMAAFLSRASVFFP
ncbi:MAG: S-layer homology domain-containing protein, partial [Acidimicrobiia bacterium]|nr:S-layer homology domain-containing protein [Acidimicrobiia bacterium]